jgi:hypothetical protein
MYRYPKTAFAATRVHDALDGMWQVSISGFKIGDEFFPNPVVSGWHKSEELAKAAFFHAWQSLHPDAFLSVRKVVYPSGNVFWCWKGDSWRNRPAEAATPNQKVVAKMKWTDKS